MLFTPRTAIECRRPRHGQDRRYGYDPFMNAAIAATLLLAAFSLSASFESEA
jgi:hypothetical protein